MSYVPPDLDIVIVTYNSIHVVGELLDSLPAALDGLMADVLSWTTGQPMGPPSSSRRGEGAASFVRLMSGTREA